MDGINEGVGDAEDVVLGLSRPRPCPISLPNHIKSSKKGLCLRTISMWWPRASTSDQQA